MAATSSIACPVCNGVQQEPLLTAEGAPVACGKLYPSREAALAAGECRLQITLCLTCDHVWNAAHQDSADTLYDEAYYSSKAASFQGRQYQEDLAYDLDRLVGLRGKTVLEIGCGDGFFLKTLNSAGAKGIGFEPSSTYHISKQQADIQVFHKPFPFEDYVELDRPVHLVVMRHVLEHLASPTEVMHSLRTRSLGNPGPQFIFLEVPNVSQLLEDRLYFDFYNDHIHYFSQESLSRLLSATGWAPLARTEGRDEFLGLVSANADYQPEIPTNPEAYALHAGQKPITEAAMEFRQDFEQWKSQLVKLVTSCRDGGQRLAVWGAGSRGVALLSSLELPEGSYSYVVDSDAKKHGKFLPTINQPICSPEQIGWEQVDCVLVTSYTYFDEIYAQLDTFRSNGGKVIRVYPNPEVV